MYVSQAFFQLAGGLAGENMSLGGTIAFSRDLQTSTYVGWILQDALQVSDVEHLYWLSDKAPT